MRLLLYLLLLLGGASAIAPGAFAQELTRGEIALQNQMLQLQQQVQALQAQVSAGGGGAQPQYAPPPVAAGSNPPTGDLTAQLLDRVSWLEDQVRALQGSVDELRNGLQQQNDALTKQLGDLSFRVQTLEGGNPSAGGGGAPQGAPPGAGSPTYDNGGQTPQASPPPGYLQTPGGSPYPQSPYQSPYPPQSPYPQSAPRYPPSRAQGAPAAAPAALAHGTVQQGYAALARRDYSAAESIARDNLAPKNPHAYDAQFLLAQSLAGQKNYSQAALAFDDTYNKSHRGAHAQDALVGLASSLTALGEKPAACATLSKLRAEFPAARADLKNAIASVGRRAACG